MTYSLEDLKKNGGKLKEFKFLTPLSEILEKEHGKKILESEKLREENIREMLEKLNDKKFVHYSTPTELKVTKDISLAAFKSIGSFDANDKIPAFNERLTLTLDSTELVIDFLAGKRYYYGNTRVRLTTSNIYVVTDEKAFEDYVFLLMLEEEATKKAELEKDEKEKRENTKLSLERKAKYNLSSISEEDLRLIEFIEAKTDEEKFKAFKELLSELEGDRFYNDNY